jgi:hypothetical protein
MSSELSGELGQEFQYLLLFAALSGRTFTKSELGIALTAKQIEDLSRETKLLDVTRKGSGRLLSANERTLQWVGANLNTELAGKNKAVLAILHLIQAKTDAYLKVRQVSLAEFLNPSTAKFLADASPVEPHVEQVSGAVDTVRQTYLALSSGEYEARVLLKDLRKGLILPRHDQDAAFMEMIRSGEAEFYPEDDPMSRDEEDDRAALVLADRRRHVVYLYREPRI